MSPALQHSLLLIALTVVFECNSLCAGADFFAEKRKLFCTENMEVWLVCLGLFLRLLNVLLKPIVAFIGGPKRSARFPEIRNDMLNIPAVDLAERIRNKEVSHAVLHGLDLLQHRPNGAVVVKIVKVQSTKQHVLKGR